MKKLYLLLVIALVFSRNVFAQTVTWADNIACLLYTHCTKCHNPNGIAPFSLIDYQDAYDNASAIQIEVNAGTMPPWPPDQTYNNLAHPRTLTQQEIDLINDWISQGGIQGNPGNAPVPPTYSGAAQITNPDLTVQIPQYTLPVTMTSDIYRCFVMPSGLSTDKYATSLEVLPGNSPIVHHVLLYEDTSSTPVNLDNGDPGPGYTCFGGTGSSASKLIGGWTPGSSVDNLPAGMGVKLSANTRIVAQIHYPMGSDGQMDTTRMNFKFSSSPVRQVYMAAILNETRLINGPLYIPANTVQSFTERYTITGLNYTLISAAPHMHLLGQSIKSYFVDNLGDTTKLINIPDWDFHWQGGYYFRQPIKIPIGAKLYAEATYDNTTNNPDNPNDPPEDVTWGEQTTDEMMMVFFGYLPYLPGDENMIIDTSTTIATYTNCDEFSTGIQNSIASALTFYPNPASGKIFIKNTLGEGYDLTLMNVAGVVVLKKNIYSDDNIDVAHVEAGVYMLRIESSNEVSFRKIIISANR
jgi:hypothetical protein